MLAVTRYRYRYRRRRCRRARLVDVALSGWGVGYVSWTPTTAAPLVQPSSSAQAS